MPLVRERNFALHVKLVDLDGNLVENTNKISLNVRIYTEDNPPILIKTNTQGKSATKGGSDKILSDGLCIFSKIQIREVTSHYRNSKVFVVVMPSEYSLETTNHMQAPYEKSKNFIDYSMIQPLILSDISVKAKSIKKSPNANLECNTEIVSNN